MSLLIMLLTMSLTALYGQTGNDTLTCYNNIELKLIANKVLRANECDTLLILSNRELLLKDSIIVTLNNVIDTKDSIITIAETISKDYTEAVSLQSDQIDVLTADNKKLFRRNKFLKVGWTSSLLAALTGVLVLVLR